MDFRKSLFGYRKEEVINEIKRMDSEFGLKMAELNRELDTLRSELKQADEKENELKAKLEGHAEKERYISNVMMTAQINAQKVEEQARERAHMMLEASEDELRKKQQELEILRTRVIRFKEEFRSILDNYRVSVENIKETPDEANFTPTLITNDKSDVIKKADKLS